MKKSFCPIWGKEESKKLWERNSGLSFTVCNKIANKLESLNISNGDLWEVDNILLNIRIFSENAPAFSQDLIYLKRILSHLHKAHSISKKFSSHTNITGNLSKDIQFLINLIEGKKSTLMWTDRELYPRGRGSKKKTKERIHGFICELVTFLLNNGYKPQKKAFRTVQCLLSLVENSVISEIQIKKIFLKYRPK